MNKIFLAFLFLWASFPTFAQSPDVVTTNEIFQDWQLNCVKRADQEQCNMSQTQRAQNGQIVAVVNVTRSAAQTTLEFGLPLMLDLQKAVKVDVDGILLDEWSYSACNNQACFIIREDDEAALEAFAKGTSASLLVGLYKGQDVRLNISLLGFSAALLALKEKST